MNSVKQVIAFSLLLATLCSCEEQSITREQPTAAADQAVVTPPSGGPGGIITNGPSLPLPTIITQTYVPTNSLWAHTRCRAWRITWPPYPVGTNANLIPTVFTVKNGLLNSFNFLNNTSAANTYKTNFNLYHNNKLETANTLWDELTHSFGAGDNMETTWFNKTDHSAATVESWVKGRPSHFQTYWDLEDVSDTYTEMEDYQQGDIYLFKLDKQKRYGGIRIVSMSPRIIEVYLAEPNN